jgi:ubiquinone/menaquinone biosynthesis C-methylase UbiE
MDYDQTEIPEAYDAGRAYRPDVLRDWLERIARYVPAAETDRIIDLGCGTGRYTAALAAYFQAEVLGVDPSEKMLAEARGKRPGARIRFVQGNGEALPAVDASADLVFLSLNRFQFSKALEMRNAIS